MSHVNSVRALRRDDVPAPRSSPPLGSPSPPAAATPPPPSSSNVPRDSRRASSPSHHDPLDGRGPERDAATTGSPMTRRVAGSTAVASSPLARGKKASSAVPPPDAIDVQELAEKRRKALEGVQIPPRLYDEDDTGTPIRAGSLPAVMQDRLAKVESELAQYRDRRIGVGKALMFMDRMNKYVMEACEEAGQRARSVYDQDCLLEDLRTQRREAQAEAKEHRVEVTRMHGENKALKQRIKLLERQHDMETAAFVDAFQGFHALLTDQRAQFEERLDGMNKRILDLSTMLRDAAAVRAKYLAHLNKPKKETYMEVEDYVAADPFSQKGVKSYLLLNETLKAREAELVTRDAELVIIKRDNHVRMAVLQRKLRDCHRQIGELKASLTAIP